MDGRSWSPKGGVRRDDQFTAAPDFYDEHDSDPLPMWGRLAASWHGTAPMRRVLVASSLLVIAGSVAAIAIALSSQGPPGPSPQGPVGASEGGPSVPSPSAPSLGNLTATPSPSASPPPLPLPSFPPPVPS